MMQLATRQKRTNTLAISKSGSRSAALLTIQHRLWRRLSQFKPCVHFLQVSSQFCDLLFQLLNRLVLFCNL